jgi:hypothetical protein
MAPRYSISIIIFPSSEVLMKAIFFALCVVLVTFTLRLPAVASAQTQTFDTSTGPVKITPLYHASTLIEAGGKTTYLDPAKPAKFAGLPKADLILITDIHGDHMDPDSIKEISKGDTEVFAAPAVVKTVTSAQPIANGETKTWQGWTIEAIAAYNLKRGPAPGKFYHDKGRGNGYVLTYGGKRFYFFRRYRGRAGNARSQEHRRGVRLHEPALHDAARRGG